MPKPSAYARKIQQDKDDHYLAGLFSGRQEMGDIAAIVLHEEFGFGPERLKRFSEKVNEKIHEVSTMGRQDTPDGEYSRAKFEAALREAYGEYYQPREERYQY